jgi:hypothetical protein
MIAESVITIQSPWHPQWCDADNPSPPATREYPCHHDDHRGPPPAPAPVPGALRAATAVPPLGPPLTSPARKTGYRVRPHPLGPGASRPRPYDRTARAPLPKRGSPTATAGCPASRLAGRLPPHRRLAAPGGAEPASRRTRSRFAPYHAPARKALPRPRCGGDGVGGWSSAGAARRPPPASRGAPADDTPARPSTLCSGRTGPSWTKSGARPRIILVPAAGAPSCTTPCPPAPHPLTPPTCL